MDQRKKIEQNVKSEITVLRIKLKKNYNKLKSYDWAVNIIHQLMYNLMGF